MRKPIIVLYIQTRDGFYAQCLTYDIGAQGRTQEEAERAFLATWHLQARLDREAGREPFSTLKQAPDEYWEMADKVGEWDHSKNIDDESGPDVTIPPAFMLAGFLPKRDSVPSSKG